MGDLEPGSYEREVRASKAELAERLETIGRTLAAEFNADPETGPGWIYRVATYGDGSVDLYRGEPGSHIHLSREKTYRKGAAGRRLRVEARHPSAYAGDGVEAITVGFDRPAAAMAADIRRRFLPAFLATLDQAAREARQAEQARRARIAFNREITDAIPNVVGIGGTPPERDPDRTTSYWNVAPSGPRAAGLIRIDYTAQNAEIKLTGVPRGLALAVLRLIHPRDVLQGALLPPALTPARPELPEGPRIVRGTVLRPADDDH